jgi:hypothetical protein
MLAFLLLCFSYFFFLLLHFFCVLFIFYFFLKHIYIYILSLPLAKIFFGYFFSLTVLFWFLVLNFMNVQIHIGSCKMITDLFLHTVFFFLLLLLHV